MKNRKLIPCNSKKSPMVKGGFYAATNDDNQINQWTEQLEPPLWGSPTGCDHFVVDIDAVDGLTELQDIVGKLPETLTAKTPRGIHLYFKMPEEVEIRNRQNVVTNVDVRGEGGYVITWPFENANQPMAEAPPSLIELIRPQH